MIQIKDARRAEAVLDLDHEGFQLVPQASAVLIKTYDSARDGRNRFTIHTAFADPNSSVDAAPRQSLETRCFVFY